MYLTDMDDNPVAGKRLLVTYAGKDYTRFSDSSGKFVMAIDAAKNSVVLKVSFAGDDDCNPFTQTINVQVEKSVSMTIGNDILLSNGYLRVYLYGPSKLIANRQIQITVQGKTFTQKTNAEGFVVFKPGATPAKNCRVTVKYDDLEVYKTVKCIEGNVINPFKKKVPTKNGVPNVDYMPKNFVMADKNAKYTLKKSQYREVLKRDSYCLYLYGKLSKYTFFKTKTAPDTYHILKRTKWNVIERALYTKLVKKNRYNYWPKTITANLKGKSYTYSEVRDIQNTGYTCGPTSASVCSQVLKNFRSEKYFQIKGHVTNGINIPVLKRIVEKNKCRAYYFHGGSSFNNAVKQLKKGAALIAFLPNHYISVIDVSPNGKKVLVSNSYGSYNVGCRNVPTNWVSVKYLKSKFAGVGLVVKPKYKLSKATKNKVKNSYSSMGGKWNRQNVNERIPNIGR